MSSNYDLDPIPPNKPCWPGILALLILALIVLSLLFNY